MGIKEERLRLIQEWVTQDINISISDLRKRLNVSGMTVWRDLETLKKQGLIERVHGGVIKRGADVPIEPIFEIKYTLHMEEKKVIARYAARNLVSDNEIIILEGGTTVGGIIPFLTQGNITVLTNNLNILLHAANHHPTLKVMSSGGILRENSPTFVGPHAESFFKTMKAHTYFLGAVAINLTDGITDPDPIEIQVKHAMRKSANKVVLLIDSSKFGTRSLEQIFALSEIDILVTDKNAPQEIVFGLRNQGVDVRIAE